MIMNTTEKRILGVLKGLVLAMCLGTSAFAVANEGEPQQKDKTEQVQKSDDNAKRVNINTATLTELDTLPRIGPAIGQRIIDFRTEHGGFKNAAEIMNVRGIGEKTFEKLKDLITVK